MGETAREATAEPYHDGFLPGLPGEVSGIGGLAGTGNAKIYIQLERMPWVPGTVQEEPEKSNPENIFHIKNLNFSGKGTERGGAGFRSAAAPSPSNMEHALEHHNADADQGNGAGHQEQGRIANCVSDALDPAKSGGKNRANRREHAGQSTNGSTLHNVSLLSIF